MPSERSFTAKTEVAIIAIISTTVALMKSMSAKEAKNAFGILIDTARAEPVLIEKHGRGVVVVLSVEEYERLSNPPQPRLKSRQHEAKKDEET